MCVASVIFCMHAEIHFVPFHPQPPFALRCSAHSQLQELSLRRGRGNCFHFAWHHLIRPALPLLRVGRRCAGSRVMELGLCLYGVKKFRHVQEEKRIHVNPIHLTAAAGVAIALEALAARPMKQEHTNRLSRHNVSTECAAASGAACCNGSRKVVAWACSARRACLVSFGACSVRRARVGPRLPSPIGWHTKDMLMISY